MEKNNKLALYVAYFLARFNDKAYEILNFGNQGVVHKRIGEILNVNPHTVKNMRDEFDPLFGHRAGWYQRPLSPSREVIVNMLMNYTFDQVHSIVKEILDNGLSGESVTDLTEVVANEDDTNEDVSFGSRAITGKKAEELFKENYLTILPSFKGELIDTTLEGTGYDFKNSLESIFVEVKGSATDQKGLLLTEKEWELAKKLKDQFYIILIYSIFNDPEYVVIQNPVEVLNPKVSIKRTITINWNVKNSEVNDIAGSDSKKLIR